MVKQVENNIGFAFEKKKKKNDTVDTSPGTLRVNVMCHD